MMQICFFLCVIDIDIMVIWCFKCWIYKHFPSIHGCIIDDAYDETSPCVCRWLTTKAYIKGLRASAYQTRLDALSCLLRLWLHITIWLRRGPWRCHHHAIQMKQILINLVGLKIACTQHKINMNVTYNSITNKIIL